MKRKKNRSKENFLAELEIEIEIVDNRSCQIFIFQKNRNLKWINVSFFKFLTKEERSVRIFWIKKFDFPSSLLFNFDSAELDSAR